MVKNEFLADLLGKKSGSKYDVAVMYSGGKDSSYLLYLLKEVYGLRVVAVMVDNGYEHEGTFEQIGKFTDTMGVELVVIRPERDLFTEVFHTLIVEYQWFQREKTNHVCFICNNILWCSVAKYAADNDIPFVASGLSLAQLSSGRPYPLEPNKMANAIAEKSTKQILKNSLEGFYQCKSYQENEKFKLFIDGLRESTMKVTTVYPYIYHQISVDELKTTINERGWLPPGSQSIDSYISSGCEVMGKVVCELEKVGLITLNEREQSRAMISAGLLSEKEIEYAFHDASKDTVDLSKTILSELQIKDFLLELCKEQGKTYIGG